MLYIIGTPIGNLDDISQRQAQVLMTCSYILAEDTRSATILMDAMSRRFKLQPDLIHKTIVSYYKDKEFEKLPYVLELLEKGENVALISESGMPIISDPGQLLVHNVIKRGFPLLVIPGPTAITTALVYSGFNYKQFLFLGFLPKKVNEKKIVIQKALEYGRNIKDLVAGFYESPRRINETLTMLNDIAPEMPVSIGRELTKKFEEIIRGVPFVLKEREYKGEITVILKLS